MTINLTKPKLIKNEVYSKMFSGDLGVALAYSIELINRLIFRQPIFIKLLGVKN